MIVGKNRVAGIKIKFILIVLFFISVFFLIFCGLNFAGIYFIPILLISIIYWFALALWWRASEGKNKFLLIWSILFAGFSAVLSLLFYVASIMLFTLLLAVKNIDLFSEYGYVLPVFGVIEIVYFIVSMFAFIHTFELHHSFKEINDLETKGVYVIRQPYGYITSVYSNPKIDKEASYLSN